MNHIVQSNGNSLAYTDFGDKNGCPILVQHGLIASIQDFYLFDRLIQAGARLICIARPGYGASSPFILNSFAEWAEAAGAVIAALDLSYFDILGMSSGAPYGYAIAARFPEKARRVYIFSGLPALYDEKILSLWPYEIKKNASLAELQELAYELFFSQVSGEDLQQNAVKDAMMNDCFGPAQDLRLRGRDWGFTLSDVHANVFMEHSRDDSNVPFATAALTSGLLPSCEFTIRENGGHFSEEALSDFLKSVVVGRLTNDGNNFAGWRRARQAYPELLSPV